MGWMDWPPEMAQTAGHRHTSLYTAINGMLGCWRTATPALSLRPKPGTITTQQNEMRAPDPPAHRPTLGVYDAAGSPAESAGVKPGWIVASRNGQPLGGACIAIVPPMASGAVRGSSRRTTSR